MEQKFTDNAFVKFYKRVVAWFVGLWNGICTFFRKLPGQIGGAFVRFSRACKGFALDFVHGHWTVKLSYLFMGAANIGAGQYIKGVLYLLVEGAFIAFMALFGGSAFVGFFTLGTIAMNTGDAVDEWGNPIVAHGDNSLLMLLYGVCTLLVLIAFAVLYFKSIRSGIAARTVKESGGKPKNFRQEIFELFDQKLYKTMLAVPILCVLAFTVVPLVYMILMAFTSYDHNHLPPASLFDWIGFETFGKVFANPLIAGTFFPLLGWTLVWALIATSSCYFAGIFLAMLINRKGVVGVPYDLRFDDCHSAVYHAAYHVELFRCRRSAQYRTHGHGVNQRADRVADGRFAQRRSAAFLGAYGELVDRRAVYHAYYDGGAHEHSQGLVRGGETRRRKPRQTVCADHAAVCAVRNGTVLNTTIYREYQ